MYRIKSRLELETRCKEIEAMHPQIRLFHKPMTGAIEKQEPVHLGCSYKSGGYKLFCPDPTWLASRILWSDQIFPNKI